MTSLWITLWTYCSSLFSEIFDIIFLHYLSKTNCNIFPSTSGRMHRAKTRQITRDDSEIDRAGAREETACAKVSRKKGKDKRDKVKRKQALLFQWWFWKWQSCGFVTSFMSRYFRRNLESLKFLTSNKTYVLDIQSAEDAGSTVDGVQLWRKGEWFELIQSSSVDSVWNH